MRMDRVLCYVTEFWSRLMRPGYHGTINFEVTVQNGKVETVKGYAEERRTWGSLPDPAKPNK